MQQKHDADERDDDALLRERSLQRHDRVVDEVRSVIDRNDLDALRQGRRHIGEARLHIVDNVKGVLTETLQRNAARDLTLPVELGNTSALIRSHFDPRYILQQDRRTLVDLQDNIREIGKAFDVTASAHNEFKFRQLYGPSANIHVAAADGIAHLRKRDTQRAQTVRIEDDVVLLDEAADAGDFGNTLRLGNAVADGPILQRSQVGQRFVLGLQRILIDQPT